MAIEDRQRNVALLCGAALLGGLVIGFAIGREGISSQNAGRAEENSNAAARADAAGRASGSANQENAEAERIVLGNISTIPFQELYSVLSKRPPVELAELAQQIDGLPSGHGKDLKSGKFFKAWAQFDAIAALKAAAAFDTPSAREKAISAVVEGADASEAESLANAINQLPADALTSRTQRGLLGRAATKWSEINAPAAAAFIDALPAGPWGVLFDVHTIAQNWAASDPQAALAWAQQRDSASSFPSNFATNGAISGWWQKDPAGAEAYAASRVNTLTDRQLASTLASMIYQYDPQRAIAWANQLQTVEARQQADGVIAIQMSSDDPKGAAEWAASLPQDVRSMALNSAVGNWAQNNSAAAADWLGSLSGSVRDPAVSAYSIALSYKDPANALNWAMTISDPQTRDNSVQRTVQMWMRRNAADATAWVQNSLLPDDQKQRLLQPPPGG